jgi:phosphate starvation-inducible protein PhoH and related proteins
MPLPQSAELFFGLRLTEEQLIYANSIYDNLFTGVQARAGSGKTTVAIGVGKLLNMPVHYIFPTVQERALGYTTGDQRAKESKYLTPLIDALIAIGENPIQAIISDDPKQQKKSAGWIHAYSHNYMRGGNIKDSLVIIDEAQNLTKAELRTILTRIHDSCHVVVAGDWKQCDIDPKKSGFMPYLSHYSTESYAQLCELTKNFRGRISAHAETI